MIYPEQNTDDFLSEEIVWQAGPTPDQKPGCPSNQSAPRKKHPSDLKIGWGTLASDPSIIISSKKI